MDREIEIRVEKEEDYDAIDTVLTAAFGKDKEAKLVRKLREDGLIVLSLVALLGGRIVGSLVLSRIVIKNEKGSRNALALAPLAVVPEFQKSGVGTKLMEIGLQQLKDMGEKIVILLGHTSYYSRFGFSSVLTKNLKSPFSGDAYMALELEPGVLASIAGEVIYPEMWL